MQIIAKPTSLFELWDSREIDLIEMMKIVVDIRPSQGNRSMEVQSRLLKELLRFREMLGETFISLDPAMNRCLMDGLIRLDPAAYNAMS